MSLINLTVVVVAKNEAENISDCMSSLSGANRYIVVDNGSADDTVEIAKESGATVFEEPDINNFSELKGIALSKIDTEWGFLIDADERVSSSLKDEIERVLCTDKGEYFAYKIPRKNHYFGKFLRYGGNYPDYQVRLFRKDSAYMDGKAVHERISIDGEIGRLRSPIIHYTYNDITDYLQKQTGYLPLMVEELENRGVGRGLLSRIWWLCLRPNIRFIRRYILKLGFLDGYEGYLSAYLDKFIQITSYYQYIKK